MNKLQNALSYIFYTVMILIIFIIGFGLGSVAPYPSETVLVINGEAQSTSEENTGQMAANQIPSVA